MFTVVYTASTIYARGLTSVITERMLFLLSSCLVSFDEFVLLGARDTQLGG